MGAYQDLQSGLGVSLYPWAAHLGILIINHLQDHARLDSKCRGDSKVTRSELESGGLREMAKGGSASSIRSSTFRRVRFFFSYEHRRRSVGR